MEFRNCLAPYSVSTGSIVVPATQNSNPAPAPNANPNPNPNLSVVQEYSLSYKLYLTQEPGTELNYCLTFPCISGKDKVQEPEGRFLHVYQHVLPPHKDTHTWNVRFRAEPLPISASDGGPPFTEVIFDDFYATPAYLHDEGTFTQDDENSLRVARDASGEGKFFYQVFRVNTLYTMLEFQVALKRRFSKRDWNLFSCGRVPEPKSSLLEGAEKTGDLILRGGEGVEVPAHSAILVNIPYFEAKLREEWAGKPAWNLHNKLRLELPAPVKKESLDAFLKYVYGDTRSLYQIEPTSAQLLQDVLTLADSCGVPALCADVVGVVLVTSANVDSWLAWLLKDHGVDTSAIRRQVVQVMKDKLQNGLRWEALTVEQLANIAALQNSLAKLGPPAVNRDPA